MTIVNGLLLFASLILNQKAMRYYPYHLYLPQVLQVFRTTGWLDFDQVLATTFKKLRGQSAIIPGDLFTDHEKFIFIDKVEPDGEISFLAGHPKNPGEMEMLTLPLTELEDVCAPDGRAQLCFVYNTTNYFEIKNMHLKAKQNEKNNN